MSPSSHTHPSLHIHLCLLPHRPSISIHRAPHHVSASRTSLSAPPPLRSAGTQCFAWWDSDGTSGICVDRRLGFGGAFAPNRFERVSTLVAAHVQSKHAAFDAAQPPPHSAQLWSVERRSLQAEGNLPAGDQQLHPRHLQVFIDDFSGSALGDRVDPSGWGVDAIVLDPAQILSEGGTPAPPSSRAYVHAQLTVLGLRDAGLNAAPHKVVVGDPIIVLGLRVSRRDRCIDCPPVKRSSMLDNIQRQLLAAVSERSVDRQLAETLVGRIGNLSQVFPEVTPALHGGYTIVESSWVVDGRRRQPRAITMRAGSDAHVGWVDLLELSYHLISDNSGVDIAPELSFPPRFQPGMITTVTDASGNDGFGGYAFAAEAPDVAYIMSEAWPSDILTALANGAATASERDVAAPSLSVSAAELFIIRAMAVEVAATRASTLEAITAITDSDAAAGAVNAATSGTTQMRSLLEIGRGALWLAVSVERELNTDADRLSHPRMYDQVADSAAAAGLEVVRVRLPLGHELWSSIRIAAALGVSSHRLARD